MDARLQTSIILIGIISLLTIILMIRKEKVDLKYSMLWIASSAIFILLAIYPAIPKWFARLLGIYEPSNAVFLILILFEFGLNFSLTIALSKQATRLKDIAQALALIEKQNRDNGFNQAISVEK